MEKNYQDRFDPLIIARKTSRRLLVNGLIALVVSIVIISIGLVLFPLTTTLPAHVDWGLLEGITSLFTLAIIIGGLVFAYFEHTQASVQRGRESAQASFNLYKEIDQRLNDPLAIEARRWIIINVPTLDQMGGDEADWLKKVKQILNETTGELDNERPMGKEYLKQILHCFDFIGFVALHYWSMENELVEWMSPLIGKIWMRVGAYVEDEALRRNEADFFRAARDFGNYCLQWRREHYPDSKIIEDAT